MLGLQAW